MESILHGPNAAPPSPWSGRYIYRWCYRFLLILFNSGRLSCNLLFCLIEKQLYELSDNTSENAMVGSCRLWYLRQSVCDWSPCMVKKHFKDAPYNNKPIGHSLLHSFDLLQQLLVIVVNYTTEDTTTSLPAPGAVVPCDSFLI